MSASPATPKILTTVEPAAYERHFIHTDERTWAETNCYMDVLIELIHYLGFDPVAGLAPTLAADFEEDQWTFFKYDHHDLRELYGLDVQELNPWRPLATTVETQVKAGRPVLVELDSYYLPDTQGTAYREAHVKSTVAVIDIDVDRGFMRYFHGQGLYDLDGQDFRDIFSLDGPFHDRQLPPYIEVVKPSRLPSDQTDAQLTAASLGSLRNHVARIPETNPFKTFRQVMDRDIGWLAESPVSTFHEYSFATFRQYGACFELAATYLDWLANRGATGVAEPAATLREISTRTKAMQFKLARSMARQKPLDMTPLDEMAELWRSATDALRSGYLS